MAIVQTLSKSSFIDAFKQSSRKDQFSYDALTTIFDYLDEYSNDTGETVELDIVGVCCDWSESNWSEVARDYSVDLNDFADDSDDDNRIKAVAEFLWDNTTAHEVSEGVFVYQQF